MDLLFEIISDPKRSDSIKRLYDFGNGSFIVLTAKNNVFSREEVSTLWGTVIERDRQIASLNHVPAERDGQIVNLSRAIADRDGQIQALAAFEQFWNEGIDDNIVIVGKEGWKGLPDDMRRTVRETVNQLRHHPELSNRLFWLKGISDEYLEKVYAASTCLIAASEGEGFGLPLIEAAQHKLPIVARDIPVFREVAGEHAFYFRGLDSFSLANAVSEWLALNAKGLTPQSIGVPWLTWRQSAAQLLARILPAG